MQLQDENSCPVHTVEAEIWINVNESSARSMLERSMHLELEKVSCSLGILTGHHLS